MSEQKGNDAQFNFLIAGFGIIAGVAALYRLYSWSLEFGARYSTKIHLIEIVALVFGGLYALALGYNKFIEFFYGTQVLVDPEKILVGYTIKENTPIYTTEIARTYGTLVPGSTGGGKSEGIIIPWAFDDIEKGRGFVFVDGKPEAQTLKRLYGKAVECGRAKDFLLLSLSRPTQSNTFNPLASGESNEVAERIFASFQTDNAYYSSLQYSSLKSVLRLIQMAGKIPKPGLVLELLRNKALLTAWTNQVNDPNLFAELANTLNLTPEKYQENFSGLIAYFENFTTSNVAQLLNQDRTEIDFENVLLTKKIVYLQLPTLAAPTLAPILGKLAIQSFAATVGKLQESGALNPKSLFSLYLDDFNDYIYKEFASVTSKVRSGGVGIVFAHQSLADLNKVSPDFKDTIVENTNNKIIFNVNDPDSAEFFSKYIGTELSEKTTERRTKGFFGAKDTGEQSVRETEAFIVHPNIFKKTLKPLEGVAVLKGIDGLKQIERIRCVPVKPGLQILPPNRTFPAIQFVAEARMFGEEKDQSQPTEESPQGVDFNTTQTETGK